MQEKTRSAISFFCLVLLFLENSTHELDKVWFFAIHQDADAVNAGGEPADKVGTDDQN